MGVSGSGKSTLGRRLADSLGYVFIDGDDFHSTEAIECMRSGAPITEAMRDAWVDRLEAELRARYRQRQNTVLVFSGLRTRHRRRLMQLGFTTFAFMLTGTPQLLTQRLAQRARHFMPVSQLPNQLASMEPLQPDEAIETVDVSAAPDAIVAMLADNVTL